MGVFARLLRRSSRSPRKPAPGAATAAEAGAGEKTKEEGTGAEHGTGDGHESQDVGIPKQQSAGEVADSEAADDARN